MNKEWSNLAKVVFRRTYSRHDNGPLENWQQTVERAIMGNVKGFDVPEAEIKALLKLAKERKAGPAGRGYWFSGSPAHEKLGSTALCNCWYFNSADWHNFVIAQDMLMLGGGVGLSVEHRFSSKLPKVKKDVKIEHKNTKDATFIVPDSREGWCELTRMVLESFFETGKSFTYSTICLRGYGEPIKGFGGISSGPIPVINFVQNACKILQAREGKYIRPIDAADILTAIGEMVVAGNVRRSAIIILGDSWDKAYLTAKRWDLGALPSHRSNANYSVVCDDTDDLHPLFWKTYEHGEPFGIINRTNIQKFGRMGEAKKDTAEGVNPCGEATLENGEPCNLTEQALCNFKTEEDFIASSRLMMRYAKRVSAGFYHQPVTAEVVKRNRRVGNGITGCLSSPLFTAEILDKAYEAIQEEDAQYSKALGIPKSIRTTVIKPSGTMSKVLDCAGYEGIHAPLSRYWIQRVRFSSNDALLPLLKAAGHVMEPVMKLDGSIDPGTVVVDFYAEAPKNTPVANEGYDTWKQLDTLKFAQKHWADQAVSVTAYYKKDDIPKVKEWLSNNLDELKTVSFLCHNDHGFLQAPKESITKEKFEELSAKIKPINLEEVLEGTELNTSDMEDCITGCPIK